MARETNRTRGSNAPALRVVVPPEMKGKRYVSPKMNARPRALPQMQAEARTHVVLQTKRAGLKRRLPPEVLSDAEVCALMEACGRYTPTGLRDRALIALLYRAGLRINEALSLYPKDLDLADGSVRVLHGKGGRSRTVGIDPGAAAILERWLEARTQCLALSPRKCYGSTPHDGRLPYDARCGAIAKQNSFGRFPVFCTLRGRPMAAAYVRVLLKRLAARAGIDKRVHGHGLRHTHAAQLRAEGVDIGIISKQLGHASITTTARYLDHLAPRAVIETMRRRSWAGLRQRGS